MTVKIPPVTTPIPATTATSTSTSTSRSSSTSSSRRRRRRPRRQCPPRNPHDDDDDASSSSSPLEKSCFVCHLFMIPVAAVLVGFWIWFQDDPQRLNETVGYLQLPDPRYIRHIPVSFLLMFFAVPLLYCTANSMTVPDLQSTEVLHDQYTTITTTATIPKRKTAEVGVRWRRSPPPSPPAEYNNVGGGAISSLEEASEEDEMHSTTTTSTPTATIILAEHHRQHQHQQQQSGRPPHSLSLSLSLLLLSCSSQCLLLSCLPN